MKALHLLFYCLVIHFSSLAQCPSELEKYTTGFDGLSSFSFLDEPLKDVKIVGFGEDTHGTKEFTQLAGNLLFYLSEKHNIRLFILETGFGEGLYLNDYIQGKRDDLKNILNTHNSTWRYRTPSFYKLMQQLREYNQQHTSKIHLYGCEMQYVTPDVERIRDYLKTVGSDHTIKGFEKHLWQTITEEEKLQYYHAYSDLKKHFVKNYETFVQKTSEEEFQITFHLIEILEQFVTAIHQRVEQRKRDFRDIYMAENIQWILQFHGEQSKAFYWAHNAHVGDWISNGIVDVAGHQLKKMYGSYYFNIATDFGLGEFKAFSRDWKMETFKHTQVIENTFTQCLQKWGKPNTYLNLQKAREKDQLRLFLTSPITHMSGAGAQIRTQETITNDIGQAFDGIIYLNQTNSIQWLE